MARTRLDLDIEFQKCRTWGHAWSDFIPGVGVRTAPWGQRFHLRCDRCRMERHDTFDLMGEVTYRRYIAPNGYAYVKDEKPSLQRLRRSLATALHEGDLGTAGKTAKKIAVAKGKGEAKRVKAAVKKAPTKRKVAAK